MKNVPPAEIKNHPDIFQRLLKIDGIDFKQQDALGMSVAMMAAGKGLDDTIRVLHQQGKVDLNALNILNKTVAMTTAFNGKSM